MIKFVLMIFLVFGITSCSDFNPNKPTTFCKIINNSIYVVDNFPNDTLSIKKEVEMFIYRNFSVDSVRKKDINLFFYKADKHLTCDFEEGEPYAPSFWEGTWDNIQYLGHHNQNNIINYTIYCRKNNTGFYTYRFVYNKKGTLLNAKDVYVKFNDIDSLFIAKQKEYGIK